MGSSCRFEHYKPVLAMVAVQSIYAAMALSTKAAFNQGMSPMVFIVYRQATATVFLLPTTILARGCSVRQMALGVRGFCLVFAAALIGVTMNQNFYYAGMDMADATVATATSNLIPAITFVMTTTLGIEKVRLRSMRSMAKVLGTIICVGSSFFMAFVKGPILLDSQMSLSVNKKWMVGCFLLMLSMCCWSLWLILQGMICARHLDPLSLAVWMCFLATIQTAILTLALKPDFHSWKLRSIFQIVCCLFSGIFGSGASFYLQSWSISRRGPLFSAMFNPLNAVIATVAVVPVLHEELHVGSVLGAIAVVGGLYVVLWGKAGDFDNNQPISGEGSPNNNKTDTNEPFLITGESNS